MGSVALAAAKDQLTAVTGGFEASCPPVFFWAGQFPPIIAPKVATPKITIRDSSMHTTADTACEEGMTKTKTQTQLGAEGLPRVWVGLGCQIVVRVTSARGLHGDGYACMRVRVRANCWHAQRNASDLSQRSHHHLSLLHSFPQQPSAFV